jgi:hypothetical protein
VIVRLLRRSWRAAVLVTAVAAGVLLVLLGYDLQRTTETIARDDAMFRAQPFRDGLWRPPALLPFGAARGVLALDDDLAYRNALQLFAEVQVNNFQLNHTSERIEAIASHAQSALAQISRSDPRRNVRSQAADLVGVLTLAGNIPTDPVGQRTTFEQAIAAFENAIQLDPGDDDAKVNLEYVLRRNAAQDPLSGRGTTFGASPGSGSGLGAYGSGY